MATDLSASPRHVVPASDFLSLTRGCGDATAVRRFAGTERSWRMISLHHLITALLTDDDTSPLPPVIEAWRLLVAAEGADDQAAATVLMHPHTGIWIAHMLRRLRGVVTDESPLWADAGYLHTLAAAAAIRAGLDFDFAVPVRSGAVVLPTLGLASVDGRANVVAVIRCSGGMATLTVDDQAVRLIAGDPAWRPMVRCESEVNGLRIGFFLDDVDPYRNLRGYAAPDPLGPEDVDRWQRMLAEAWQILVEQDRVRAEAVAVSLASVTPLPPAEAYRPLSASCDEAFGAVVASMPVDGEQLAVTLIHETQHVKLGALLHLVQFVDGQGGPLRYAAWRDDPRPLSGLLQGIYAFVGITAFWRHRRQPVARFEFALWRIQLIGALAALIDDPWLSEYGRELIGNLYATVAGWHDDVEPGIAYLADLAAADHYGQWRAAHVPVPGDWTSAAVSAWTAGEPCPAIGSESGIVPVTDTRARWLDGRAVLARMRLGDPDTYAVLAKEPADVAGHVPGTLAADLALISGNAAEARDGYVRHLARHADDSRAWVGLGLAQKALGVPAGPLVDRPELTRAIGRQLPGVNALKLVEWMTAAQPLAERVDVSTISNPEPFGHG